LDFFVPFIISYDKKYPGMKSVASNTLMCVFTGMTNDDVVPSGSASHVRRLHAFTLVELLVVIGIIALLVSVLLPALNKARQQANLIDCQSRLRQMGQALGIYVSENNGLLPYGDVAYVPTPNPNIPYVTPWLVGAPPPEGSAEPSWFWDFALSKEIQANILGPDKLVHNLSGVFKDVDTIQAQDYRYVNHYTCNPQIFQNNYDYGWLQDLNLPSVAPQFKVQRKLSQIRPSNVFLIWDAPQCADWNNNAYEQATEIDGNALTASTRLFLNSPDTAANYNRPIYPGQISGPQLSTTIPVVDQKKWNIDLGPSSAGNNYWATEIRFRHLNNTTLNALCVDGHVETRAVGTMMVLDICMQVLTD
jgi:prepilin-type N-terminal cleavage/methylation domain-containing protein